MAASTDKSPEGPARVAGTAGLAAHVGVSRWTVSRVLNGHTGVREQTRQRVLAAVERLGFEPNRLARGLRGVPSGLVGVSFPHLEAMVLAQKSQALARELRGVGYRGIFEMPEGDPEVEAAVVRHFLSIKVDGIVLIGSTLPVDAPVLREVAASRTGIVAVDPREPLPVARVSLDRAKAVELKVRLLHDLGHRRIAVLGFRSDDMYGPARIGGVKRAAKLLGLDEGAAFVWLDAAGYGLQDYRYGAVLAEQVLALGPDGPTALLCLNDRMALGAMVALRQAGRRVPEDYSVVGFDNLPETAWTLPPLTTIDQNIPVLMGWARRALWNAIQGGSPLHKRVEPRLVLRASTGPARRG